MARRLQVLFRRDPSRDRQRGEIRFEGYQMYWPDGRAVATGLDGFCYHGQRLLGLGKYLAGYHERLIELICFPLTCREDDLTRIPGHRVRRFCLARTGRRGRLHFLDGTPTDMIFEFGRDEPRVLHWLGLSTLRDGANLWFDLAARTVDSGTDALPLPLPGFVGAGIGRRHVEREIAV
jgi:hypothetical protein